MEIIDKIGSVLKTLEKAVNEYESVTAETKRERDLLSAQLLDIDNKTTELQKRESELSARESKVSGKEVSLLQGDAFSVAKEAFKAEKQSFETDRKAVENANKKLAVELAAKESLLREKETNLDAGFEKLRLEEATYRETIKQELEQKFLDAVRG